MGAFKVARLRALFAALERQRPVMAKRDAFVT